MPHSPHQVAVPISTRADDEHPRMEDSPRSEPLSRSTLIILAAGAVLFVWWRAWVSDDAFITFRHVANLWAGSGPVYNPGERVQGFTHPLWFVVLAAGAGLVDVYAAAILIGLAATAALILVLGGMLRATGAPTASLTFASLMLLSSVSFVEYQTSGLENCLTNLLVVLLWSWLFTRLSTGRPDQLWPGFLLCSLLVLTRPDHIVLCAPPLVLLVVRCFRWGYRALPGALIGVSPLIAWIILATIYYGSPVPNTAYAKLALPLPIAAACGVRYLWSYAVYEPVHAALGCVLLLGSSVAAIRALRLKHPLGIPAACAAGGILLQIVWLVLTGGDFMRGRFLVSPLVATVTLGAFLFAPQLHRVARSRRAGLLLALLGGAVCFVRVGRLGMGDVRLGAGAAQMQLLLHPTPVIACFVLLIAALVFTSARLRRTGGAKASTSFLVGTGLIILYVTAVAGRLDPPTPALLVLGACLTACCWLIARSISLRRLVLPQTAAMMVLLIASVASLCDFAYRDPILRIGNITDQRAFTGGEWADRRFREPGLHMHNQAVIWASEGDSARRYAQKFGPIAITYRALGLFSYHAGPQVHVIDRHGLTDAFVARCPRAPGSQVGHTEFNIPRSYLESAGVIDLLPGWRERLEAMDPTLREEAERLRAAAQWTDPVAARLHDRVKMVISAPVFSPERLKLLPEFIAP